MITLETNNPIAYDSPDHIMPWGTARDNHTNSTFIKLVLEEYGKCNFLDLGCSGGQLVIDFHKAGCVAAGLEGSDYSVKHKRANWPEYHNKNLFTCDVTKPYKLFNNGKRIKFDVITAWEVVEHIHPDNLHTFFNLIYDNLKEGGLFCGSITSSEEVVNGIRLHQSVFDGNVWNGEIFPKIGKLFGSMPTNYNWPVDSLVRTGGMNIMIKKYK